MSRILYTIVFLIASNDGKSQNLYRVAPEWEDKAGYFVSYNGELWDSTLTANAYDVIDNLIKELAADLKVYVLVANEFKNTRGLLSHFRDKGINISNIEILVFEQLNGTGVCRDFGPIMAQDSNGKNVLVQFNWAAVDTDATYLVSNQPSWVTEIRNKYFDKMQQVFKMPILKLQIAITGGEIETNGNGTIMLVESVTKKRNANFKPEVFDSLLQCIYGKSQIIWLKEGSVFDPEPSKYNIDNNVYGIGLGGHIDEFAKVVNDSTIFLAYPDSLDCINDPIKTIMYNRMKINYSILSKAYYKENKPFHIVRMPIPDILPFEYTLDSNNVKYPLPINYIIQDNTQLKHGNTIRYIPNVSYLNYIISNNKVIIPKYWRYGYTDNCAENDKYVYDTFQKYFPEKKIIQLDVLALNFGMGGLHCWTQHIPASRTKIINAPSYK